MRVVTHFVTTFSLVIAMVYSSVPICICSCSCSCSISSCREKETCCESNESCCSSTSCCGTSFARCCSPTDTNSLSTAIVPAALCAIVCQDCSDCDCCDEDCCFCGTLTLAATDDKTTNSSESNYDRLARLASTYELKPIVMSLASPDVKPTSSLRLHALLSVWRN